MLKATIIGNLGGDTEMRHSGNGSPFLRFNVASNYRSRTQDGEWQDRTEWVRVTVFGQRAETLSQYLKKGSRVYVEGRLEARPWTDQQGQVRSGLEVLADEVQFMSPRQSDDDQPGPRASVADERSRQPDAAGDDQPRRPSVTGERRREAAPGVDRDAGDVEDLPF